MRLRRTFEIMLDCQRDLFSLPAGLHYLNCAYMSPLMRCVEEAGVMGMRRKRIPSDISAADFFTDVESVRRAFARLVGVTDPDRVALIPAASYGLAVAAQNVAVRRGQNLVVVSGQFPSNVYVWRRLADEQGAELRTVTAPAVAEGRGKEWNARLQEAIDGGTALVALGQVHWTDGTVFDLEAVGMRAREVGAALVVDGTQSVGAMPFDVAAIEPDALVCAGYKWLLGPYSIGVAYFGPRFDNGRPLEETWISRPDSEDFRRLVDYQDRYRPGALRYDVGETSNFVLVPMLLAALRKLADWGVPAVLEYCSKLTDQLVREAAPLGFDAEEREWRSAHLVGLRLPERLDPDLVSGELARQGVSVSVRGDVLRVSPHVYNDAGDISAVVECLDGIVRLGDGLTQHLHSSKFTSSA